METARLAVYEDNKKSANHHLLVCTSAALGLGIVEKNSLSNGANTDMMTSIPVPEQYFF